MTSKFSRQQKILSLLKASGKQGISANELFLALNKEGVAVSLATIYRLLDDLTAEGLCVKDPGKGGPRSSRYIYEDQALPAVDPDTSELCPDTYYLKCEICGRFIPLHCSELTHLKEHIKLRHDFVLTPRKTVLIGLCGLCERQKAN